MMAAGHLAGAGALVLGLGLAQIAVSDRTGLGDPMLPGEILIAALLALPFSAGPLSPDADLPKGRLGWLGHRRGAHWIGWPLLVIFALAWAGAPFVAYGPALGWLSHLWPCDWMFGKGGPNIPKGIPRWPWRGSPRHGLGLRTTANNGRISRALVGTREHAVLELAATFALTGICALEVWLLVQT